MQRCNTKGIFCLVCLYYCATCSVGRRVVLFCFVGVKRTLNFGGQGTHVLTNRVQFCSCVALAKQSRHPLRCHLSHIISGNNYYTTWRPRMDVRNSLGFALVTPVQQTGNIMHCHQQLACSMLSIWYCATVSVVCCRTGLCFEVHLLQRRMWGLGTAQLCHVQRTLHTHVHEYESSFVHFSNFRANTRFTPIVFILLLFFFLFKRNETLHKLLVTSRKIHSL